MTKIQVGWQINLTKMERKSCVFMTNEEEKENLANVTSVANKLTITAKMKWYQYVHLSVNIN